ncbi:hypothetical protein QE152_g4787 [Popillia japonica]|uniref:Uncharacterized protein n=1 Tax=Popillia japonica TaxID=7064 RepID=A0AAW1MZY1_POPJA
MACSPNTSKPQHTPIPSTTQSQLPHPTSPSIYSNSNHGSLHFVHSTPIAEALPQQGSIIDFFNSKPEAFYRSMCEGPALLIEQVKMLLESRKGLSDAITFTNACLIYFNGISNMSKPSTSHIKDTVTGKYQQLRDAH